MITLWLLVRRESSTKPLFCRIKRIKREFGNARTPQQNGVAKRKNRTLIENRVLVTKPHNKTPYELLIGRAPIIGFMRPFGCLVTILNTLDHLGKFDGKADEGLLVGYSIDSKAFRVYNSRTKKVEENIHVNFLENKPNVAGSGQEWLFDIDSLTNSMNYQSVSAGNRTNGIAGSKIISDAGQEGKEKVSDQEYILLPVLNTSSDVPSSNEEVMSSPKDDAGKKLSVEPTCVEGDKIDDLECLDQQMKSTDDSKNTNTINAVGSFFSHPAALDDFFKMPNLEDTGIFDDVYDDRDEGAEADYNNLETVIPVSPIHSTEFTKIIPKTKSLENEKEPLELNGSTETRDIREGLLPDIMFAVCAYSRFQVQPKVSHMHALLIIIKHLKGHPTLGLWYPKDLPLELIAYSDSDYAGASLDRKSTTGGCQFLGSILISWQCKKQTIMVTSTTKSKYIAASSYCGQFLWLQNQLLDYGYNFMQTKIHVDNESAICVVKNPVYHSKTKHIEIMHHFIRDSYKKRLIEMVKIHNNSNVIDLITKVFDVTRFQFLVASIGLLNP
nr:putative ribonuclease H-like domain-containing protein [Tanacetum cinerariifolium]